MINALAFLKYWDTFQSTPVLSRARAAPKSLRLYMRESYSYLITILYNYPLLNLLSSILYNCRLYRFILNHFVWFFWPFVPSVSSLARLSQLVYTSANSMDSNCIKAVDVNKSFALRRLLKVFYIGCSNYSWPSWSDHFAPGLKAREWLRRCRLKTMIP